MPLKSVLWFRDEYQNFGDIFLHAEQAHIDYIGLMFDKFQINFEIFRDV